MNGHDGDDSVIDASLISWESGTDLVLDTVVSAGPSEVWRVIAHPEACEEWFAPFTLIGDDRVRFSLGDDDPESGDDDPESGDDGLDSGDNDALGADDAADGADRGDLEAEILDWAEDSHVLLEFAALGRLGISLRPGDAGTRVTLTCTFDTAAEAAEILPEVGPVWDTHLRLLREAVGEPPSDVPEGELTGRYERLADQARREAESGGDEATEDSADGR